MKWFRLTFLLLLSPVTYAQINFPTSLDTDATLLVQKNNAATSLAIGIDNVTTTVVLASGSDFASNMVISIGLENILCTTLTTNTCTGSVRGYDNTTAVSHLQGVSVFGYIVAANHNQLRLAVESLEANTVTKFHGSGPPGSITGSKHGDQYVDDTNKHTYTCFLSVGPCTTVTAGNWQQTDAGGGGGGGSVFTGSTASASTGISGTATNPIFSLADQSVKSPICFEVTIGANVASVVFNNLTSGASWCIDWLTSASSLSITYGSSVTGLATCQPSPNSGYHLIQRFKVRSDGTTVDGDGCRGNDPADSPPNSAPLTGTDSLGRLISVTTVPTAQMPAFAGGDFTTVAGGVVGTLNTVNANVGACGDSTHYPIPTFDGKGRVTGCTNQSLPAGGGGGTGFSGTANLGTGAISPGACATVVTVGVTGLSTTNTLAWTFSSDPTGVVGYQPSTSGMLTIIAYPTANNANFKVCNDTASSVTPGAITLNWDAAKGAIASGTSALNTSLITSGTCDTVVTTTASGTTTSNTIAASFNGDPTAVTGYTPNTNGMLTIIGYPGSGVVNWKVCNNTSSGITPGAITLNWQVF